MRIESRWKQAIQSKNENARLESLINLNILDSEAEERFDRLSRLATRLIGVPIAALSLVDSERQWFKSSVGQDLSETPRDQAFCSHTIQQDEVLIIPDAFQDDRFAESPLVQEQRHRFYAGAPLTSPDGHNVGAFCVIDHRPRNLSDDQIESLKEIAAMVQEELFRLAIPDPN